MTLYAERLLPHNTEAEEALIGSLLIDGECVARIAPMLQPGDFYRERNQLCYDAALALSNRNQAVDQLTLAGELARTEKLELVGGMAYLSHLVASTPTSVHAEDYAEIVSRTATMRKLIAAGSKIAELGYSDTDDLENTLRQAEDAVYGVRNTTRQRDFQSFRDIFDRYLQDQASAADLLTVADVPLMTGFSDLDELLGGVQRSDLMILAARPSVGKSTLALNMAMHNAKTGRTCAIFSLEMTADQLALRALAAETGIDSHRLRLGLYTTTEEDRIMQAAGMLSDLPVHIDDTPYQGMVEIRGKARRLHLQHGLDLVMVDYLQLVQGQQRGQQTNRVQEITEISRSLKVLAGELDVAVIACSQLNRMVENRPNNRPRLSDLRDSGSIEQDADVVMFIHREDMYVTEEEWGQTHPGQPYPRGMAELIVAKHRKGPNGSVMLQFRDNQVRFDPRESEQEKPPTCEPQREEPRLILPWAAHAHSVSVSTSEKSIARSDNSLSKSSMTDWSSSAAMTVQPISSAATAAPWLDERVGMQTIPASANLATIRGRPSLICMNSSSVMSLVGSGTSMISSPSGIRAPGFPNTSSAARRIAV